MGYLEDTVTERREMDTYAFMSVSKGENSDTSEWLPFPEPTRSNIKKRNRQSSSEEALAKDTKRKPTDNAADEYEVQRVSRNT